MTEAGGEASVFGMSSGAVLAAEAAARGVPVTKLVMYEPPMVLDDSGPPPQPDYVEKIEGLTRSGDGDAMAYFVSMVGMPEEQFAEFRQSPIFPAFAAVEHTLAYDGRIMEPYGKGEPIPPGAWDGALQPTVVIAGGDSPDWMQNAARAAADAVPDGDVRTCRARPTSSIPRCWPRRCWSSSAPDPLAVALHRATGVKPQPAEAPGSLRR